MAILPDLDLWVCIGVLICCLTAYIRSKFPRVPYSGCVILLGLLVRLCASLVLRWENDLNLGDETEEQIIEFIFLPALIAECALSLDSHIIFRHFSQILLLAITAVGLSSVLTAAVVKYVLKYDHTFDWFAAIMIGAIFSATDHVSVVASLKEVKANDTLATLMQGETLFNDGTVWVLFVTMMRASDGQASGLFVVETLANQSFGAMGMAGLVCLGISLCLDKLRNLPISESLLTLVAAYLLFYLCERPELQFSGAFAVVCYGLYMSTYGKAYITPTSEKAVHHAWKFIATALEGLILMLGSFFVGSFVLNVETEWYDLVMAVVLFVLLYVVRTVVILVHWPVLTYLNRRITGEKFDLRWLVVLIFGGLKGTMSISLALVVDQNSSTFTASQRHLIMCWAVMISCLSNTIGAVALGGIIRLLKLEDFSPFDRELTLAYAKDLVDLTGKKREIPAEVHPPPQELREVLSIFPTLQPGNLANEGIPSFLAQTEFQIVNENEVRAGLYDEQLVDYLQAATGQKSAVSESYKPLIDSDLLEMRKYFYKILKATYEHQLGERTCARKAIFWLIQSANYGIDNYQQSMKDWQYLSRQIEWKWLEKCLKRGKKLRFVGSFFEKWYMNDKGFVYDCSRSFIYGHKCAQKLLSSSFKSRNLDDFLKNIKDESSNQMRDAYSTMKSIVTDNTHIPEFVKVNQLRLSLLHFQQKRLEKDLRRGVVDKYQFSMLSQFVREKIGAEERKIGFVFTAKRALARIFPDIEEKVLEKVSIFAKIRTFAVNEEIQSCEQEVAIVLSGGVKNTSGYDLITHEVMNIRFIWVQHIDISEEGPFVAFKATTLLFININAALNFQELINPLLKLHVARIIRKNSPQLCQFRRKSDRNALINNSELKVFEGNVEIWVDVDMLFVSGRLESDRQFPFFLEKTEDLRLKTTGPTLILAFKERRKELDSLRHRAQTSRL